METLLTRRQTLQSLAFSAVFGGSILSLVGCGGGDDATDNAPANGAAASNTGE